MTESFGNYNLIKRVKLDFTDVVVSKWKSTVTGLTVIHLDYQAPIVNGYFVVATEIFDDSGCPHTLEHLVFAGSENYPHKGSMLLLANRAFSRGVNAWTSVDHTGYTLSTAGGQGLLQLLPIYIDHILYPTITDAGFVAEVHHIDGRGHDSGVVYCEMQGRENTAKDLMYLRLQRSLVAPSGYRSRTGGLMEELRILTPEKIRKYHASYYAPHNLVLVVAGKLVEGTSSLLRVVQEQVEPSLIRHNQNKGSRPTGWKRPFLETPSAQSKPTLATKSIVEFPDKDEGMGRLIICFVGPPLNDFLTRNALDILGVYLTSSTISPLSKEYIEIESPLCSHIGFSNNTLATYVTLEIHIDSVPTRNLDTFDEKLTASLKRIGENGIDTQRMAMVINRAERRLRNELEKSKAKVLSASIIEDFLYGAEDGSELHPAMDEIRYYSILRSWTGSQWAELLSKFYVEQQSAVIIGKPSASFADNLAKAERARIANQIEKLGPEGLKEAERKLEAAKEDQRQSIPTEILTSFPIPDVKSICWIPVQTLQEPGKERARRANPHIAPRNEELQKHIESDGEPLPFLVEYDHAESDFVSVHAFFSLDTLPNHLRPYMSAYLSAFFSLPVVRNNGVRLTHEEVVKQLENDTVLYEAELGVAGCFRNLFHVSIKVEPAVYETAVAWLRDLIYQSEFNLERMQVVLAKIQQKLPQRKRIGMTVLKSLWDDLMHTENSMSKFGGVFRQTESIPKLIQRLQDSPEEVLANFESIRKHIVDPSSVRFSVTGNVLVIKKPRSTWAKYFGPSLPPAPLSPVPLANQTLSAVARNCSGQAVVMGLPTIENTWAILATKGIQGFDHAEYPAIRLAIEVLNATGGYLWRCIRGSGLAYGVGVILDVEAGLLKFSLRKSSNPMKAFEEASSMMRGLVDGSIELTDTAVAAAMSTIVYRTTEGVSTTDRAVMTSFVNQALRGVSGSHHIDLLEKYQAIKKEDILAAFQKHFLPLFDPASSVAIVVTASDTAQSIREGLTSLSFDVTQEELHNDPTDADVQNGKSGRQGVSDSGIIT